MTKTNKPNKKTIGEMANSRMRWAFDPSTRIIKNKKGKGSYNRKKEQSYKGSSFFLIRLFLPGNSIISVIPVTTFGIYQVET
ncbi:alternative ribosome rescue factor ArfA [Peribacillus frigoritolerans]